MTDMNPGVATKRGTAYEIPAGPLLFVLETRRLETGADGSEDGGNTLRVYNAAGRLEHLRFDCFEKQPHYHYVNKGVQRNEVKFIDRIAVDPVEWALLCVRDRLCEMLEYAGARELASAVRADRPAVDEAIDRVSRKFIEISRAA